MAQNFDYLRELLKANHDLHWSELVFYANTKLVAISITYKFRAPNFGSNNLGWNMQRKRAN